MCLCVRVIGGCDSQIVKCCIHRFCQDRPRKNVAVHWLLSRSRERIGGIVNGRSDCFLAVRTASRTSTDSGTLSSNLFLLHVATLGEAFVVA